MRRLKDTSNISRTLRWGESVNNTNKVRRRLHVWYRQRSGVVEFEASDYTKTTSDPGHYRNPAVDVSDDLATLVLLFIGERLPAGVLADKLQDEHPNLEWASEMLREWDQLEEEL